MGNVSAGAVGDHTSGPANGGPAMMLSREKSWW